MKSSRSLLLILIIFAHAEFLVAAPRVVDDSIGTRISHIFPEIRNGYIDLNQNGSLDQLEDMDEMVPESRLKDYILHVPEIFDFFIDNYRYPPISKFEAVRSVHLVEHPAGETVTRLYDANGQAVDLALARGAGSSTTGLYRKESKALLAELADSSSLNTFAALRTSPSAEIHLTATQRPGDTGSSETTASSRSLLDSEPEPAARRPIVYPVIQTGTDQARELFFALAADEASEERLIPLLEEKDPARLEPLIDRRLKREKDETIRSIRAAVLAGFARAL